MTRPRVALVNPNTSTTSTALMVEVAASVAPTVAFDGVTAEFGQALITEPVALGVAADAVEALAPRLREYDAVIVAAYGDPGHARLARALAPIPVVGIGESSMAVAAKLSDGRFSVATTIGGLVEPIRQLAASIGCGGALVSVRAPAADADAGALMSDARALEETLAALISAAIDDDGARAVVIGGGPLARAARALAPRFPGCPIVEPIPTAVQAVLDRLAAPPPPPPPPLLVAPINYTRTPAGFSQCGAFAGARGFALLPSTFRVQHGSVPMGDMDPEQLAFEHVPVHCTIGDARSLSPAPTMDTHGFELINPSPPLTPLIARDATASGAPLDLHLREIEAAVARAMGASGARSFCHVVRTARPTEQGSAPYAFQAHTDQAAGSWSGRLRELVSSGEWDAQGPPGVPPAFARRCAKARRYAVITAWRYLGPADACRGSHLAMLDPYSIEADDVLDFPVVCGGNIAHNLRLRAPPCAEGESNDGVSAGSAVEALAKRHVWWHYPGMVPSKELLLLIAYDSLHPEAVRAAEDHDGTGTGPRRAPYAPVPSTSTFHSAVVAAHAPAEEPERESIDTRVLVVWDDEAEATEAEEAKTAAAVEASSPPPPPHTLCVTDAVAAMRRGSLTAVELMESCLGAIATHDGAVGAIAHVDVEQARADARAADATPPELRGPLHGIPFAVKDIIDVAGMPTTHGSSIYARRLPSSSAAAVEHLRAAGAVLLGKTTTTEFAMGRQNGTRNPHNLAHSPGASSSGSAAAVASRFVPAALGTQTAGSLLRPAAFCGVVVWKATRGLIALDGVLSLSAHLDSLGVFARRPVDLMPFCAALTGAQPPADAAPPADAPPLRLGLLRGPHWLKASPDARRALEETAACLSRCAGDVVSIVPVESPPTLDGLAEHQISLQAYEQSRSRVYEYRHHHALLSPKMRAALDEGLGLGPEVVTAALAASDAAAAALAPLFGRFDALLCLPSAGSAPRYEDGAGDPLFTRAWTLLGLPAVGLPVALPASAAAAASPPPAPPSSSSSTTTTTTSLPLGVQLVGPRFDDVRLLHVAETVFRLLRLPCPLPAALQCDASLSGAVFSDLTFTRRPSEDAGPAGRVVAAELGAKLRAPGGSATLWPANLPPPVDLAETTRVLIRSARGLTPAPTLASHGFELRVSDSPLEISGPEGEAPAHAAEIEALVREATGARLCKVFNTLRRMSHPVLRTGGAPGEGGSTGKAAAVTRAHCDYTESSGPARLHELIEAGLVTAEELNGASRLAIVNAWRPTTDEVPRTPLAVCDATSADGWFDYGLVHHSDCPCCGDGSRCVWYNFYLPPSLRQRWYWYPRQRREEVLLFKTYDSAAKEAARFVAHSAFEVPGTPESAPERQSIECRVMCVW